MKSSKVNKNPSFSLNPPNQKFPNSQTKENRRNHTFIEYLNLIICNDQ